jgi:hypothetical protein
LKVSTQIIHRSVKGVDGIMEKVAMERVPHHLIKYAQISNATHVAPVTAHSDDEKKGKMQQYGRP